MSLQKLKNIYAKGGSAATLHLIGRRLTKKLLQYLHAPLWLIFRIRFSSVVAPAAHMTPPAEKEKRIQSILSAKQNGSFLEIGIGEYPYFERIDLMLELGISYTGCDFASVCKSHFDELALKIIDAATLRYLGNSVGTYSWTLFELLSKGEKFDVIYMDGHHTFYIDFPAILLAAELLKPDGYLILDDVEWSLAFLKKNMSRSLSQWYFYRKVYDFSQYSEEEQHKPHIKMIASELLVKRMGFAPDHAFSLPDWWVLQKKRS